MVQGPSLPGVLLNALIEYCFGVGRSQPKPDPHD